MKSDCPKCGATLKGKTQFFCRECKLTITPAVRRTTKPASLRSSRKGVGDLVADIITVFTRKESKCGGCKKRQAALNQAGWVVARWFGQRWNIAREATSGVLAASLFLCLTIQIELLNAVRGHLCVRRSAKGQNTRRGQGTSKHSTPRPEQRLRQGPA